MQSMTKTDTMDVESTVGQIKLLEKSGCEIVRIAVRNEEAAVALSSIVRSTTIPVIADIHFDWKLALKSIESGVAGLRLNPGNIGAVWKTREVVSACKDKAIPVRIGVNGGSLPKDILEKYEKPTPEAIVESAERHMEILESMDFGLMKVSLKASNVPLTVSAYRLFASRYDYPLHIGISEAGPPFSGIIKSSVGLGVLLNEGIGDTMRVSLTADSDEEVRVAYEILKSLELRQRGTNIISCPTCGRCRVNIKEMVTEAEERLKEIDDTITVAIMGCEVNGPGEAREADYGVAGGRGEGLLFKKGSIIKKVKESEIIDSLMDEIRKDYN